MRIEVTKQGEFYPEWNGNRDEPVDERIIVKWNRLSKAERSRYTKTKNQEIIIKNFGSKSDKEIDDAVEKQSDLRMDLVSDQDAMLSAMKITIGKLETEDEDGVNPIDTWEKLNAVKGNYFDGLIEEITSHVLNENTLSEQDSKN